jgi:hypothetical protein
MLGEMLIAALVAVLTGAPAGASTETEPVAIAAPSDVVVGVVADDAPFSDPMLGQVLTAAFAGTEQRPRLQTLQTGEDLLDRMDWAREVATDRTRVVYWIEPVGDGRHRLYLFDPRTDRTWVRSLPQGSDATDVLDTTGAMIRGLTDGLPEGDPRGMERVVPPPVEPVSPPTSPPPTKEPAPTPAPKRTHVTIAASYAGTNFDASAPWQNGGALDVDVELPVSAFVRVGASMLQPARLDDPELDVWHVPIAIEVGYRFRAGKRVRPEIGGGVDVDPIFWRARESSARSGQSARVGVGPVAGLTVRLWRGLGLHVWGRLDVWAHNLELYAEDAAGRSTLLRPHPLAAFVRVGLHWVF